MIAAAAEVDCRLFATADHGNVVAAFCVQRCEPERGNQVGRVAGIAGEHIHGIGCGSDDGLQFGAIEAERFPELRILVDV